MKVKDLISDLSEYDEDQEVRIVWQPHWPFESNIRGVTCRENFSDEEVGSRETRVNGTEGVIQNDVIIIMGSQIRYGDKNAFAQ